VHAFDSEKKTWEPDPIATSDRAVSGNGRLWQRALFLVAKPTGTLRKIGN
jgi:hypothetical protein